MFCVKILHRKDYSTPLENYPFSLDATALPDLIPEFFRVRNSCEFRMAIVCGNHPKWSVENFANQLDNRTGKEAFCVYDLTRITAESCNIDTEHFFVATIAAENDSDKAGEIFSAFYNSLEAILTKIKNDLERKERESPVGKLLGNSARLLNNLALICELDTAQSYASTQNHDILTKLLTEIRDTNLLSPIHVLVFMPKNAFRYFDENRAAFFKQIEYVLLFEDLLQLYRQSQAKLDAANQQIAELQRKLDAVNQNDAEKVAELKAQLTAAQQEIMALVKIVADLSKKLAEQRENSTKPDILNRHCAEKSLSSEDYQLAKDLLVLYYAYIKENPLMLQRTMEDPHYNMYSPPIDIGKYGERNPKHHTPPRDSDIPNKFISALFEKLQELPKDTSGSKISPPEDENIKMESIPGNQLILDEASR